MATISAHSRKNAWSLRQKEFPWYWCNWVLGILLVLLFFIDNNKDPTTTTPLANTLLQGTITEKSRDGSNTNTKTTEETNTPTSSPTNRVPDPRVLVFDVDSVLAAKRPTMSGAGNLLNGLLAAHLLGLEFDRTVCVLWSPFLEAFDYSTPEQAVLCQEAKDRLDSSKVKIVELWGITADQKVDECVLYDTLTSEDVSTVVFRGNTYPGWRTDVPSDLFHQYYTPKPALVDVMPETIPKLVVHLRAPDSPQDTKDRGCGDEMLYHLGELLRGPKHYVISNSVDYVDYMHDCCGWTYDTKWGSDKSIRHSVLPLEWIRHKGRKGLFPGEEAISEFDTEQNLKLWVDWYTLLKAPQIYHADSEFSRSAVHWKGSSPGAGVIAPVQLHGIKGKILQFGHTQFLEGTSLIEQSRDFRKKPVVIPPLSQRKRISPFFAGEKCIYLRFCKNPFPDKKPIQQHREPLVKRLNEWRRDKLNALRHGKHIP